jgi:7-cyano-7-deazaguanine synthase
MEVWNGIHHGSRLHSFPDATWEFIQSFELMMTLGSDAGSKGKRIKLVSPLLSYAKTGVVNTGFNYDVPFHLTWSCWESNEKPCGKCASCKGRTGAFAEAKLTDPQSC